MSRDSCWRNPHPELVDSFDEFLVNVTLPDDPILVAPEHLPINPESEDEVPNQEAVNGIARAKKPKEPAWRDLGLRELAQALPTSHPATTDIHERLRTLKLDGRSQGPPAGALRSMR